MTIPQSSLQSRSIRQTSCWCWMASDILTQFGAEMGPDAIAVYIDMARYANNRTGQCWPSPERMSTDIGCPLDRVEIAITRLVALRLISVHDRPGRCPLYTLLALPAASDSLPASRAPQSSMPAAQDTSPSFTCTREEQNLETKQELDLDLRIVVSQEENKEQTNSSSPARKMQNVPDETPSWEQGPVKHDVTRPDDALAVLPCMPEQFADLITEAYRRLGHHPLWGTQWPTARVHTEMLLIWEEQYAHDETEGMCADCGVALNVVAS